MNARESGDKENTFFMFNASNSSWHISHFQSKNRNQKNQIKTKNGTKGKRKLKKRNLTRDSNLTRSESLVDPAVKSYF